MAAYGCLKGRLLGFSLIELLVSVLLMVILITFAIPAFSKLIADSQLISTTHLLRQLLHHARAEAVKAGRPVYVCRLDAVHTKCTGNLSKGDHSWDHGALLFFDFDGDGVYHPAADQLLRVYRFDSRTRVNCSTGEIMTFLSDGRPSVGSSGTFTIKLQNAADMGYRLIVNRAGRLRAEAL